MILLCNKKRIAYEKPYAYLEPKCASENWPFVKIVQLNERLEVGNNELFRGGGGENIRDRLRLKVKLLLSSDFSRPPEYMESIICSKLCKPVERVRKTRPATISPCDKIRALCWPSPGRPPPSAVLQGCHLLGLPALRPCRREAVRFSETSACRSTLYCVPEDSTIHSDRC
jgi:hypothetical protein